MATMQKSHNELHPHHIYQLEVIFLFFIGFCLFFAYFLIMDYCRVDMAVAQWYFVAPWTAVYTLWCLKLRTRIPTAERISPLKRPIIHWMLFGILLLAYQLQPVDLARLYSFDITFFVFTIFLADSYWDFI
ncbi:MAG: hypothetical protein CO030_00950 [Candidatus Magasanikbacteria bacterium CG_4_9_14_0_2_um_filter_42_11]|uniref:Uncharacterized protein n=1 Tax=Candidatus Magasanikbacteria bacterium CG_4_9_14_0_2_um_filter_42_11 TaxID=1974643 RepID=A0A2M8FAP2_9BACT|nr:MAG: hypothetical protein COU34_02435 [Candidatus Magasanikbacteria bacterium CG10_big_fil_rev_8_21_14_0_10_43_9]PIY92340.1 MAG: hypothetical protein COY70_03765 [Candidatus Magasanikbacteria bacterium CG_4_10_14_0_8_um_filter_42_12]PJC52803.1 MAG: hypothetical protein CO030_00950 [Candidatus Magasanikbacteria bacterium CG_4_9_14_0_2_um_filter_42_11]